MVAIRIVLVSACLTGLRTRYDGRSKTSTACLQRLEGAIWLPVCPEQLGGLATPRCAANLIGGNGAEITRPAQERRERTGRYGILMTSRMIIPTS